MINFGKKKDLRHANKLMPSSQDMIALGFAVHDRFLDVCGTHERVRGLALVPPAGMIPDLLKWREMLLRFRKGDYRNTESEKIATRNVAQWTLDENARLRNQIPQTIEWRD